MEEITKFWRDPLFYNLEVLHATFYTHAFTRHVHEGYAIGVIERGAEKFDCGRGKFEAAQGSAVVINPEEPHTGSAVSPNGWSYRMFYPDAALLQQVASQIAGREQPIPFFPAPVLRDDQLGSQLYLLHLLLEKSPSALERQTHMIMALSTLITRYADRRPTPHRTGREDNAIARVREYIHANFNRNIELEELSAAAGLSMYHLIRVFQKETGLPPHAYLTHLRVSRAKKLIDLNLSLSQIALDTGFTDQSHFTRHFKRITGVTPGQYR